MTSESKLLGRHELAQRVGLGSRGLPAPAQAGSILEPEGNSGIRLSFRVDPRYLVIHTLVGRMQPRYRGDKDVIFGFRQRAQEIDAEALDFLRGFDRPSKSLAEHGPTGQRAERLLERMAVDPAFPRILAEAQAAAALCEREWQENLSHTSAVMKEMTGLELDKDIEVLVSHPSQTDGRSLGERTILWTHQEGFPNYNTVYLWHEAMHKYIRAGWRANEVDNPSHAVIELLTDNELRKRLGGGDYPPCVGHPQNQRFHEELLPAWKAYLEQPEKNILEFVRQAEIQCQARSV